MYSGRKAENIGGEKGRDCCRVIEVIHYDTDTVSVPWFAMHRSGNMMVVSNDQVTMAVGTAYGQGRLQ